MTVQGCDYAFSQPDPAGLASAGLRFAMRYIGPGTDDKHLHANERDQLWAAGLSIVLLAEGAANSALNGFSTGQQHASQALSNARALGVPDSVPFYFAVDFDVTSSQWPTVVQYFNGAAPVVGVGRVGIYGGIRAMQWAARDDIASWFFQTFAWSAGRWYPGNHVEQYRNDVNLAGGVVDLDRAVKPVYGQWGPPGAPDEWFPYPAFKEKAMPYLLVKKKDNDAVFALYESGWVRHIGPAEFAELTSGTTPVRLVETEDVNEFNRLLASARVAQGYTQTA